MSAVGGKTICEYFMNKYYIYVIKSLINGRHYVGLTEDVSKRLKKHNERKVRSTKAYAPYKLLYVEEYNDRKDARKREIFLKTGQGRDSIKNILSEKDIKEECPSGLRRQS